MVSKTFLIHNKSGLHLRPAGVLVNTIQKFNCEISIKSKGEEYNAKSILNIMAAGIKVNEECEFICDGADEDEALKAIGEAIATGLGE